MSCMCTDNMPDDADVIPLRVSGVVDTDTCKLTSNDFLNSGISNLWENDQEGPYLIRHGRQPVRDFGRPVMTRSGGTGSIPIPNLFERAFPCLFPYGLGGLEAPQSVEVDFASHVRWSLQYHDRRFRKHETYPFYVFGIIQHRQALLSAKLQARRKTFNRDPRVLSTITIEKLKEAQDQEIRGIKITDPSVKLLHKHIHTGMGRVVGSDQSRYSLRSQIWSTSIKKGPPFLWITINPSDLNDPIAQVFAGEKIDLDKFIATVGPGKKQRAKNIASDSYAAAKFFHFMIRTMLETLFQIKVTKYQVKSGLGLLGKISAYFGCVETQGKGSLHLHILFWGENTPTANELVDLLKSEDFRNRVVAFIRANIRTYLPGLESAESIKAISKEPDIAYSRPPDPSSAHYDEDLKDFELKLARAEQIHTCKIRRCLVLKSDGLLHCKRRAPFKCAASDYVLEDRDWGSKGLHPYVNAWQPGVLINARCNNDIKLLTNGADTRNISFYVTSYTAKKQGKTHNLSAILSTAFAYHTQHQNQHPDSTRNKQQTLIFRLINSINREQELSCAMVMSYLMGWGDVYRSHHYVPIYWSSFVNCLFQCYPDLKTRQRYVINLSNS